MKKLLHSKKFLIFFTALWFTAVAIPIGYLMGFHQSFKNKVATKELGDNFAKNKSVLHMLGADCLCSQKVANYLLSRGPIKDLSEKIIIVGSNVKLLDSFKMSGFSVTEISADIASQKYAVSALPQMFVYSDNKNILYSGGYSQKRSPASKEDYDDLKIINDAFKGKKSEARPIFGCAIGSKMQKEIDPLGLKY